MLMWGDLASFNVCVSNVSVHVLSRDVSEALWCADEGEKPRGCW